MAEQIFSCEWLGRPLTIKTGKLALQADAAVTVQYGDTVMLATVVQAPEAREGIDFFPLLVEFEKRLYAAGIIKGSRWIKREGRPSDDAILTGRMIDRALRPLFDETERRDVQVVLTVLSVDRANDYDIVALVAASAALSISGVNWNGPIGGIRVGRVHNQLIFNPTYAERETSDLDLIVSGTTDKILMLEAGANEVDETAMLEAIWSGARELKPVLDLLAKLKTAITAPVKVANATKILDDEQQKLLNLAQTWLSQNLQPILFDQIYYTKGQRKAAVFAIKHNLLDYLTAQGVDAKVAKGLVGQTVEAAVETEVTKAILDNQQRVDGRALDQIRTLSAEIGILPRNHGAGLFSRGETQVMSIVTLGAPGLAQSLEGLEGESKKRYMHHYNFPSYSVGEAKPNRGAGRREIGHGALAEKALLPVLPTADAFGYTIRVVSETLGSNGSSSMASTCASSLALMDAGVPIRKPVAGIAMGLASNHDLSRWAVLTDLQDLEDGAGGMDFKITGTADGITAIQLDTKTAGLTHEIVAQTLTQAHTARQQVLASMKQAIDAPRAELSPYAPRLISFKINPDKIREVIGSGGKVINEIIASCGGISIDIEDDGSVVVCGVEAANTEKAVAWIKDIVRDIEAGETFTGKVVRLMDFGAFVELLPGRDGLVHVSEMAPYRVGSPSDFLAVGDSVTVRVREIDDQGRVNLTMKGLTENEALWVNQKVWTHDRHNRVLAAGIVGRDRDGKFNFFQF